MRADHESPCPRLFANEEMFPAPCLRRPPGFPTCDRQWKTTADGVRQRPLELLVYRSFAAEAQRQIAFPPTERARLFSHLGHHPCSNPHSKAEQKHPRSFPRSFPIIRPPEATGCDNSSHALPAPVSFCLSSEGVIDDACNDPLPQRLHRPSWRKVNGSLDRSIKAEVKKKHISFGWNFSCFSAHLIERDLF